MPQPGNRQPRLDDADGEYYYRRRLSLRELLPAIGAGIGAGVFAFYLARLWLQRTPLDGGRRDAPVRTRERQDRR